MDGSARVITLLERAGPMSARAIGDALGVSQPSVSRWIRAAGAEVVRVGAGRRVRYARARSAFGAGGVPGIYRIDARGRVVELGALRPVAGGAFVVNADAWWLRGTQDGWYDALPWFLEDRRPQGFMGRQIAQRLADERGWPSDPRRWSDDQIGRYLLEQGTDVPGDLVLSHGERVPPAEPRDPHAGDGDYDRLADETMAGAFVGGSSAGGENPKFTAEHPERGHVLVKFAAFGTGEEARRWCDLLVAECEALATLGEHGHPVAGTRCLDGASYRFLESRRFDRVGHDGRAPMFSLEAVNAEYAGAEGNWIDLAAALAATGRLAPADVARIRWLHTFGTWIGNTDMHPGNLALAPGDHGFTLLPAYDVAPMRFAPARGLAPPMEPTAIAAPVLPRANASIWHQAGEAAAAFWDRLSRDERLTPGFRELAAGCRERTASRLGE